MNLELAIVVIVALVAGIVLVRKASGKGESAGRRGLGRYQDEHSEARRMLAETAVYRTSLSPHAALRAVEARFSATPSTEPLPCDLRLTEKTPTCLRYTVSNRTATFLETVVAASPWGAGSAVTFDVVRWLENDGMSTVGGNLKWIREDIELALRRVDPRLQVLVRANE